ncbi:NAD(P)/FAD-dependent oxidoreductase [Marixanthomonas ophiurae]|uniref:NAD(P)/FAD-dependent oxidoreductase n=1 Tax=Marixanthomonas ophiurae TaxID=387659 RepID=A0A3E1QC27_9FLAO|nr:FAD-dependent oxidoreductase [Marixanthomonas ophiurae]RFN59699.1 NAD(P)/FAD-dependent oxidoreductase [Marixanthomonas ophiurae]
MKQVDYIIVGLGIAGISFCETLQKHNKSFMVYDTGINHSTVVSGGVFNPVVLKRFTAVWNGSIFLEKAIPFYKTVSEKLQVQLLENTPIYRILNNIEEQNDWMVASDKKVLSPFLSTEIIKNENKSIKAPHGFGKVLECGKINPSKLISAYRNYLQNTNQLITETFEYEQLQLKTDSVSYKTISANKIVFSEGASAVKNPYFPTDNFVGNKGEYLLIKAPKLQSEGILKGSLFIIPQGDDIYKVGATYSRDDFSKHATEEARKTITSKLEKMISCDYEIIDQIAGVRPTVKDRKPLLGTLEHENLLFFNGLGTRGILMAPLLSQWLYDFSENNNNLPSEVNIGRFKN